ncbi:Glutaredoxin-like domain protein [Geoglobus ahangari]|uniref:Glutaredoxin-like domain protein n=1 Tax=Geoglobus ahangari TaxID=113653 RepID=A0A0F7IE14_9EURY|nr:thioredoxin family protein [Geoglobus ahangari]AKG91159.1 Glutaredoxin-like domain protein [Geoglobus ahangari]
MGLLREEDKKYLREEFEKILKDRVRLLLFSSEDEHCIYCKDTRQLLEEVAELSDKIELEVYDVKSDEAKERGVEYAPTIILTDESDELDSRVKFTGIPSGYEFTTLIKDIMFVSTRQLEISDATIQTLQDVKSNLKIEVYVTPSCPYCPRAVLVAHQFAMVSEKIVAEMVESLEFPSLADKWGVMGVPHTVIKNLDKGNVVQFVGAYPETHVINFVKDADEGKEVDMR